jgi:hypothetical protein
VVGLDRIYWSDRSGLGGRVTPDLVVGRDRIQWSDATGFGGRLGPEYAVFLELLRRGYKVTVGKAGEKEIDFICEKRSEKLYVQVTYLLASEDTIRREFGAYDGIRDNFPKYVVSMDELDMSRNGIKHRNIRDFLLGPEWD